MAQSGQQEPQGLMVFLVTLVQQAHLVHQAIWDQQVKPVDLACLGP